MSCLTALKNGISEFSTLTNIVGLEDLRCLIINIKKLLKAFFIMKKNISSLILCLCVAMSLNAQKTYTDLKSVIKIFASQRINGMVQPVFSINLFSDQRFEYQGYNGDFLIGAYSTYLNKKDFKNFEKNIKKIKQGRFIYTNPKEVEYNIQYLPLVKSIYTNQISERLTQTPETILFEVQLNQILKNSKWVKQDLAPSPFGDEVLNEVIVTMEKTTKMDEWLKKYSGYKLNTVACTDTFTRTWTLRFDAEKVSMKDMVARLDEDNLNVVGVLPNRFLNDEQNKAFYQQQELIVEFNSPNTKPEELLSDFSKYRLEYKSRIAPNMNYYTYTFDLSKIEASKILEKLRANKLVKAAQINKEITGRQ
jgi:hypothetical protein